MSALKRQDQKNTHPCKQPPTNEGHGDRTIHARIPRFSSIVAAYPDMAFRYYDVLSGRCELPSGVDADDITRKSDEAFAYDMTTLNRRFQYDEVSAS